MPCTKRENKHVFPTVTVQMLHGVILLLLTASLASQTVKWLGNQLLCLLRENLSFTHLGSCPAGPLDVRLIALLQLEFITVRKSLTSAEWRGLFSYKHLVARAGRKPSCRGDSGCHRAIAQVQNHPNSSPSLVSGQIQFQLVLRHLHPSRGVPIVGVLPITRPQPAGRNSHQRRQARRCCAALSVRICHASMFALARMVKAI